MKYILVLLISVGFSFFALSESFAYRVNPGSWLGMSHGGYSFRIYNPSGSLQQFIPGTDDAGVTNTANWNTVSWNKWRPGSIRIHLLLYPGAGTTNCPNSLLPDGNINYSPTVGWNPVGGSTTVMHDADWSNRIQINQSQGVGGGIEMRCDFGANYTY